MAKGRKKSDKEKERNREYQREYYQRNRDKMLAERADRYANDPEYREAMRVRDRRRHWFGKKGKEEKLPALDFADVEPTGTITVEVDNARDRRNRKQVTVSVYGTPAIATIINRDPQTVRKWLARGVLPEPAYRGNDLNEAVSKGNNPRLYTEDEAHIIYKHRDLLTKPSRSLMDSAFAATVAEEFKTLKQGLKPKPKTRSSYA